MFEQPELWQILAANVAATFGAFIQSGTGFGMGLLCVPLLTLIDPVFAPGSFLLASMFQNSVMVVRNRRGLRPDWLRAILPGIVMGSVAAYFVLKNLKGPGVELAIGFTILFAVAMSAVGVRVTVGRNTLVGGGAVAGMMSTVAGVPGPPLILLLQNEVGVQIRANLGITFMCGSFASITALYLSGRFGGLHALLGFSLLPGILTGSLLAGPFARFLDRAFLRPALLVLVSFGGLALILRNLL
ncbi:sulfite exporter TauE/SafE family protein [Desulfoluna butyratoxydans]|uniref:Probable membrane transporter protein n=1 Tax=Desulfoluna butyratoxydans TaxID=231438 RepID=A0A4U8YNH7_9BACT|nr:sulfite exporter TauE/SafE family protein [Desulfoluna butyratoxydans]VFQ45656.1 transmembrane protein taue-like [Desulfoluna butyratoxydans]